MTTTNDQFIRAVQVMIESQQTMIVAMRSLIDENKSQPPSEQPCIERPTLVLETAEAPTISDPLRARRKWTQQEHDDLIVLCRYLSDREVAALLGRTTKAIEDRRLNATNVRRIAS
jgi:hypothetical protein